MPKGGFLAKSLRSPRPGKAEHAETHVAGVGDGLRAGLHGGSGGDDVVHQ